MSNKTAVSRTAASPMERHKIHRQAQTPTKVFLNDPSTGEQTEDFILVLSSLSDKFLEARDRIMQEVQSIQEPDKDKRAQIVKDLQLELKVALLEGWSFPEEFDKESATDFLRNAPQVQEMLMQVADQSARFFGVSSQP